MIDRVTFETTAGEIIMPYEHLGLIMVSHSVSPPLPKTYRVSLDGADGDLDLSEWAGAVKFENREIEVVLRDLRNMHSPLLQKMSGSRCKISFSEDPEHYYEGRCERIETETRKRVTDLTMTFSCSPWKLKRALTKINSSVSSSTSIALKALRMPVIPTVVLSASCTVTWDGVAHSMTSGTYTPAWLVVTQEGGNLTLSGSGTVNISWRDGVL